MVPVIVTAVAVLALGLKPAAAAQVSYYDVTHGAHPHDVAPAPDGTVWYTAQAQGVLGILDPKTGKVTQIPLGPGAAQDHVETTRPGAPSAGPADAVQVRRVAEELIGVTSTEREKKLSAVKKLRPFDLFTDITGRKGPGPKVMSSAFSLMEVYNTVGEQFAFHRALDSEEFGLQFMGVNTNMSEFEEGRVMSPGDWFLIPLGIAHSVKDCKPDFRRMVLYSRFPFEVLAKPSMHAHESRFEVRENVLEPAPWHSEARELAAAGA